MNELKRLAVFVRDRFSRRTGIMLLLAVFSMFLLTATVWAARSASRAAGFDGGSAQMTATPTRTPRPVTPAPTAAKLELIIVAPTATPAPTASPVVPPAITPAPMPERLVDVVANYGMDPTRRFVVVDLDAQILYAWDPGQPVREMLVSTGDETRGYRTPAWYGLVGEYWGTFQAAGVYADEGWYLFKDAGSILIHGAPYKLIDGKKVYQDLDALGTYPASRGCIRLNPDDAVWFTQWNPEGMPLVILPKTDNGLEG